MPFVKFPWIAESVGLELDFWAYHVHNLLQNRISIVIGEEITAKFRHPVLETAAVIVVFEEFPEHQRGFSAGGPCVDTDIRGVFEHLEFQVGERSITIEEHPSPFSAFFLPAAHVVGWPVDICDEGFQNHVIGKIFNINQLRKIIIVFLRGKVSVSQPIHHLQKAFRVAAFQFFPVLIMLQCSMSIPNWSSK